MKEKIKLRFTLSGILCALFIFSSPVSADAKTDVKIKNYRDEGIVIQVKQVDLDGTVKWVEIGTVSAKHARTFNNVTIGSVLRATERGKSVKVFRVFLPKKGGVAEITVKNSKEQGG